jgi:hypothetical protein
MPATLSKVIYVLSDPETKIAFQLNEKVFPTVASFFSVILPETVCAPG